MITRRTSALGAARRHGPGAGALLAALFAAQPLSAQDSGTVTVDVGLCFELESADARRACFGAQVDQALATGSAESDDPPDVIEDVGADPDAGAEGTPARGEQRRERTADVRSVDGSRESVEEARAEETRAEEEVEYFGTIVAMRERLPSSYVITLDNGQIWEQVEPKRYPLRPGLEVRIYPTRWGGFYRLSGVGAGGHIQVRRIE